MFKVSKLQDVSNEKQTISKMNFSVNHHSIDTLSFCCLGNNNDTNYSFNFYLNIPLTDLLKFECGQKIDFTRFIYLNDIQYGVNDLYNLDVGVNSNIVRVIDNKFYLTINFIVGDTYSGVAEFDFDLDEYL